jgi:hypothetical protein
VTANGSTEDAAAAGLNGSLPFGDFLEALRRRGLGIDLHSYRSVARLLERWQGTNRTELRDSLAALLARDENEVRVIQSAFEEWFPVPPVPALSWRRVFAGTVAGLLLLSLVLFSIYVADERRVQQPAGLAAPNPPPATATSTTTPLPPLPLPPVTPPVQPKKPEPAPPPEPRRLVFRRAAGAGVSAALVVLLLGTLLRTRRQRPERIRQHHLDALANAKGPFRYKPAAPRHTGFIPREWVEDFAAIVGRGVDEKRESDDLDVDESLRMTLNNGLFPVLVFEPPPRNQPVLIVEDRGPQMRPWRRKLDEFVEALQNQRIEVERWVFDSDPRLVWREPKGRPVPLRDLAAAAADRSLLVLTTGDPSAHIVASDGDTAAVIRQWRLRTCITPVANPAYWPESMDELPMRVWPMTRNGLQGAAREIASDEPVDASSVDPGIPRPVSTADLERMKRLVALAPNLTIPLADALRRRFHPDIPEEVVLFLAAEGAVRGDSIQLRDDEAKRLLAEERRQAPGRELQVRRYLLSVLGESEPEPESVAHQRWQLDRAIHEIGVSGIEGGEPAAAMAALEKLAEGPLNAEVESAVEMVTDPSLASRLRDMLLSKATLYPRVAGTNIPRLLWASPGIVAVIAAWLVGSAMFDIWKTRFPQYGPVIPHVQNAYYLDPNTLEARRDNPAVPDQAKLLVDGIVLQTVPIVPGAPIAFTPQAGGNWLRLGYKYPDGHWALGNSVYVEEAAAAETPAVASSEGADVADLARVLASISRTLGLRGVLLDPALRFRTLADANGLRRLIAGLEVDFGVDIYGNEAALAFFMSDVTLLQIAETIPKLPSAAATHGRVTVNYTNAQGQLVTVAGSATQLATRETRAITTGLPSWLRAGSWSILVSGVGARIDVKAGTVQAFGMAAAAGAPPAVSGRLALALPSGATLRDVTMTDSSGASRDPSVAAVPPGAYKITLSNDYYAATVDVTVRANETTTVSFGSPTFGIHMLIFPKVAQYGIVGVMDSGNRPHLARIDPSATSVLRFILRAPPGSYKVSVPVTSFAPGSVDIVAGQTKTTDFRDRAYDQAREKARTGNDLETLFALREADAIRPNQREVVELLLDVLTKLREVDEARKELDRLRNLGADAATIREWEAKIDRRLRTDFTYTSLEQSLNRITLLQMTVKHTYVWKRQSANRWTVTVTCDAHHH